MTKPDKFREINRTFLYILDRRIPYQAAHLSLADFNSYSRSPTFPNLSLNRALAINLVHKLMNGILRKYLYLKKVIHIVPELPNLVLFKFKTGVSTWNPKYLTQGRLYSQYISLQTVSSSTVLGVSWIHLRSKIVCSHSVPVLVG